MVEVGVALKGTGVLAPWNAPVVRWVRMPDAGVPPQPLALMPTPVPDRLRAALGDEGADALVRWLDDYLKDHTARRDERPDRREEVVTGCAPTKEIPGLQGGRTLRCIGRSAPGSTQ